MKRLLFVIASLMLFASIASAAATVNLAWDAMPAGQAWTAVKCYERTGAAAPYTYTLVGQTPTVVPPTAPVTTLSIPNVATGTHVYVVRSYNGQSESADSNSVQGVILAVPTAPTTITITVTVQ